MPFIEVFDTQATGEQRQAASRGITDALCGTYGIAPEIISIYFVEIGSDAYAHAGIYPTKPVDFRVFIKIHAFARDIGLRRQAASAITAAAAEIYGTDPDSLAIYFFERDPSEVAHGGKLASD